MPENARIRRAICCMLFTGVFCAAQGTDEKCGIEGRIVSLTTGQPVKKALVNLTGSPEVHMIFNGRRPQFPPRVTRTDRDGNFQFDGIDAGIYSLSAEAPGFISGHYGARRLSPQGSTLKLGAGEHRNDLVIKLAPQGILYGRVADEDGDFITGATVYALRSRFITGKRSMVLVRQVAVSDDGSFVLGNLEAGRYYLRAGHFQRLSTLPQPKEGDLAAYYPDSADPSGAAPIDITPGAEVRGIEIRLRNSPLFSIKGKIEVAAGAAVARGITLNLSEKDEEDFPPDRPGTYLIRPNGFSARVLNGAFEFTGVPPGTYVIRPNRGKLYGHMEVAVSDRDVEGIITSLNDGVEIAGRVTLDGVTPAGYPLNPVIDLVPMTAAIAEILQPMGDGGAFRLRAAPEKYRVRMQGLANGVYVKAIRFGGQDVTHRAIDLESGNGAQLEIQLASGASSVKGVVRDAKGDPAGNVLVQIWSPGDAVNDTLRTDTADSEGEFHFDGLAPGDYRVIAWEDIDPDLPMDPAFRRKFATRALELEIDSGSHANVEVKLTLSDVIEAEAAKFK